MAFDEIEFDRKIAYGSTWGPNFKTTVVTSDSGFETRIGQYLNGRSSGSISLADKTRDQMSYIIAFFRARQGKNRGFRFYDWDDHAVDHEFFWDGTGTGTVRLQKTYQDSLNAEVRKIQKPINGTVSIYMVSSGGSPVNPASYTIDYTTGTVTGLAIGHNYYWTGQYDAPVRFDTDQMTYTMTEFNTRNWDSIPIIELLLP